MTLLAFAFLTLPLAAEARWLQGVRDKASERLASARARASAVGHSLTTPVRWVKDKVQEHKDWNETRRFVAGQLWVRGGGDGSVARTLGNLVGIGKVDPAVAAYTRHAPLSGALKRMFPFATSKLASPRATLAFLKAVAAEPGAQLPAGVQRFVERQSTKEAAALAGQRAKLDLRATALGLGQP